MGEEGQVVKERQALEVNFWGKGIQSVITCEPEVRIGEGGVTLCWPYVVT